MRAFQGSKSSRKKGVWKFKLETRLADGIFCISRYLVNFYKSHGVSDEKLFLVPSTVDPSRFVTNLERPFDRPYIGYFGSLTIKRDNVDALIRAFTTFGPSHPEYSLVLGGFSPENEKKKILDLVEESGLSSRINVMGYLTREEVLQYIMHADILVMTRSNDLAAQASYPSKLTEFLATGKPVVTMNVGEISDFLTEGENAYLVEPGNSEALAAKLDHVANNYEFALKVGKNGKKMTEGVFNYDYQAKGMIDFIYSLQN